MRTSNETVLNKPVTYARLHISPQTISPKPFFCFLSLGTNHATLTHIFNDNLILINFITVQSAFLIFPNSLDKIALLD